MKFVTFLSDQTFDFDLCSSVMYCAVASMDTVTAQLLAGIFIILWLIISRVILYDLFVVILMDNFKVSDTIELIKAPGRMNVLRLSIRSSFAHAFHLLAAGKNRKKIENEAVGIVAPEPQTLTMAPSLMPYNSSFLNFIKAIGSPIDGLVLGMQNNSQSKVLHRMLHSAYSIQSQTHGEGNKDTWRTMTAVVIPAIKTSVAAHVGQDHSELAERTLFVFHRRNIIRRFCIDIQGNAAFICLIYTSILCSCFLLAAAPPAPDVPGQTILISQQVSVVSDAVFTAIFTAEMLINIIAQVGNHDISFPAE